MIKGDRVYLRTLLPEDVEVILEWENDPSNWTVSQTTEPFTYDQIKQFVESPQDLLANQQLRYMICLSDDHRQIGTLDLFEFDARNERSGLGILIAAEADRGKGYAKEALQALIQYAFQALPLRQLFCNVLTDNEPSMRLFQGCGFKISGTKKQWIREGVTWKDEHLLQLMREDHGR